MGINFVVSPFSALDMKGYVRFQESLVTQGVDFTNGDSGEDEFVILRTTSEPLEIKVKALLEAPSVGQLVVVAGQPNRTLDFFIREVKSIVDAFEATWPTVKKSRQLIRCDATLRDLFEASQEHAFQELWEERLGQSSDVLQSFGRPVLGGGLRFVMPPQPSDEEDIQIEVKIESFLRDTKKIYVETQFVWPQVPQGAALNPDRRLRQLDDYVEECVIPFVVGDSE